MAAGPALGLRSAAILAFVLSCAAEGKEPLKVRIFSEEMQMKDPTYKEKITKAKEGKDPKEEKSVAHTVDWDTVVDVSSIDDLLDRVCTFGAPTTSPPEWFVVLQSLRSTKKKEALDTPRNFVCGIRSISKYCSRTELQAIFTPPPEQQAEPQDLGITFLRASHARDDDCGPDFWLSSRENGEWCYSLDVGQWELVKKQEEKPLSTAKDLGKIPRNLREKKPWLRSVVRCSAQQRAGSARFFNDVWWVRNPKKALFLLCASLAALAALLWAAVRLGWCCSEEEGDEERREQVQRRRRRRRVADDAAAQRRKSTLSVQLVDAEPNEPVEAAQALPQLGTALMTATKTGSRSGSQGMTCDWEGTPIPNNGSFVT